MSNLSACALFQVTSLAYAGYDRGGGVADPKNHGYGGEFSAKVILSPLEGVLICTVVLWILCHGRRIKNKILKIQQILDPSHAYNLTKISVETALCFIAFMVVLPVIILILLIFSIFKFTVFIVLKLKYGEYFKGFLDGSDVFWAIEEPKSRSIINMLCTLDVNNMCTNSTSKWKFCEKLKRELSKRLLESSAQFPKLFYKRREEFGHSFWIDDKQRNLQPYIKIIYLKYENRFRNELIGQLSNSPLPFNHSGMWEILIGLPDDRNSVKPNGIKETNLQIQILCRLHHALGDGVALMRLFMENLSDKDDQDHDDGLIAENNNCNVQKPVNPTQSTYNYFVSIGKNLKDFILFIQKILILLVLGPIHIVKQLWMRQPDRNPFHKNDFSGKKFVSYFTESDGKMFLQLKAIKKKINAKRFTDVLLSTVSCAFEDFFVEKNVLVPENMTVIVPARVAREEIKLNLRNKFSVALQTIPIKSQLDLQFECENITAKVSKIGTMNDQTKNSPEYLINYGVLSLLSSLLPKNLLCPFISSCHSTLAISNLPGPIKPAKLFGSVLRDIVFWIPNRGTMGIGISLLTYRGNLQLGIICDKNVISDQSDVENILDKVIRKIRLVK